MVRTPYESPGLPANCSPAKLSAAAVSQKTSLCFSRNIIFLVLAALFIAAPCFAQREPVLKQIDVPHPYYFREMYLPQLTTGPSAAAWTPDSKSLVYSMAGSLWRQNLDS